jgi:hypothetical protein
LEKESRLSWVLVENELCHVKDFAHLRPKLRPTTYCPDCRQQVILKLGQKNIFHAAHKNPNTDCQLTNPESALHLNAKLHIAEELRKFIPVKVRYPCDGANGESCDSEMTTTLNYLSEWDDVQVEYSIDQYRPDIVLLKNGESIGAIEVFVTHAIEPEKEKHLQEWNIPWIEVKGNYILDAGNDTPWQITDILQFQNISRTVIKWRCQRCQWKSAKLITTGFKVVDIYYGSKHTRSIYFAKKVVYEETVLELRIYESLDGLLLSVPTEIEESRLRITELFEERIKGPSDAGAIVDASMNWYKVTDSPENQIYTDAWREAIMDDSVYGIFPKKYYWSINENIWKPIQAFQTLDWHENYNTGAVYLENNKMLIMDAISEIGKNNQAINTDYNDTEQL